MATKTVISKYTGLEAVDGVIEFPQDKTLYVDQFTDNPPIKPGEVFRAQTLSDVFDHYQPEKKGVRLTNMEGQIVKENFKFHSLNDFDDKNLIEQSGYLHGLQEAIDAYKNIEQQLMKNKVLKRALNDDDSRQNLVDALKALLAELQQ